MATSLPTFLRVGEPRRDDPNPHPAVPRAVLEGPRIALEPLTLSHLFQDGGGDGGEDQLAPTTTPLAARLFQLSSVDYDAFAHMPFGPFPDPPAFAAYFRIYAGTNPTRQGFLIRDRASGEYIGHIGYLEPRHGDFARTIEIGAIWIAKRAHGQRVAAEATYLLLAYAFDELGFARVEWKCHHENVASRRTAESVGMVYEGTFRKHMYMKGHWRHSIWLAMVDDDWPAAAAKVVARLSEAPPLRIGAGEN
ncbi:acyl-CoA N-acyltransferase [Zopfochytrium polystomum]|nr:acyl-CoA N-acyltransferase [Zopfochytrium polystomum]